MNVVFEPQLDYPVGAIYPDIYDGLSKIPSDDFVVSRNRDGSVVSTYGQIAWDLSAYHPEGKSIVLNFCFWNSGEINSSRRRLSYEIRHIIFLLIWVRDRAPLSLGTLRNYLTVLRALAKYAEDVSSQIKNILIDEKLLWSFIETRCSGWAIETMGSLLPLLVSFGKEQLGFDIVGDKQLKAIRSLGQKYRTSLKQHAPIPTRIYSQIIAQLLKELAEWEEVSDDVLSVLQSCGTDPRMGRSVEGQAAISKRKGLGKTLLPTFSQLASTKCLNYFDINSRVPTVKNLSGLISEIQTTIKLTIQTFTGMRDDEALSLPYHCIEETVANGKTHYIVLGRTTKLNNGKAKRTRWVTNQDGYRAIKLAQQIADVIFGAFGITAKKTTARIADHPLFVSVSYLDLAGGKPKLKGNQFSIGFLHLERMKLLRKRLQPIIEDADIRELEHIDPHRAWRSEDRFRIGKPWLFTSHQLRRSLALYAQRSGYVSLPSLRRQLQHLTNEMSRYYAKGSASAKNFIDEDKDHFGLDWQRAQPESAALSYVLNVLLSNDILFGGHANWVEHTFKGSEGVILVDRETTLRRFRKGDISYKETPYGGCTKVGECEQPVLNWLHVDCLKSNCRNLVGNLTKLERVIAAQNRMVKALDQSTIEYRIEKADLEVLLATREAVLKAQ
jgi:hypothetical protein